MKVRNHILLPPWTHIWSSQNLWTHWDVCRFTCMSRSLVRGVSGCTPTFEEGAHHLAVPAHTQLCVEGILPFLTSNWTSPISDFIGSSRLVLLQWWRWHKGTACRNSQATSSTCTSDSGHISKPHTFLWRVHHLNSKGCCGINKNTGVCPISTRIFTLTICKKC